MLKMLTNCASAVRRRRGVLLFVGLAALVPQLPAQETSCKMQSDQVSAAVWGQIIPPPGGIAVAFYDDAASFVGLNHVYADSQNLTHRWRSFIPWTCRRALSAFSFRQSDSISGQCAFPLFYVSHTTAALDASEPDAQRVHLVRAATKQDTRRVQITSGWSAFTFHPGFTAREEIPLRFHVLSSAVYTIQPEKPLDDGEYLVIFGPSAPSGFEFQIACSEAHRE